MLTRSPPRSAFTLIELLIVIGIISVLAAVMLPSLSGARRAARRALCLSNLRQIGTATILYAQDNADEFPASLHWGFDFSRGTPWGYALFGYVGGERWSPVIARDQWVRVLNRNYRCPLDRIETRSDQPLDQWSYGINVYLGPPVDELRLDGLSWQRLGRIPRPSATVAMAEMPPPAFGGRPDHVMAHFWSYYRVPTEGSVDVDRHLPNAGYGFVDGHAAPLRFRDTFERVLEINKWNPATAR